MPELKLAPIVVPKTSDVLANELRKQILGGALAPGAALPAERDLVTQTGLSRGSVREALRILEAEGLVSTRPGRLGGSVARQPGDDSLAKYISLFVHGRGITLLSLLQTREAVRAIARRARRAEPHRRGACSDLSRSPNASRPRIADTPLYLAENVNWHCAIAAREPQRAPARVHGRDLEHGLQGVGHRELRHRRSAQGRDQGASPHPGRHRREGRGSGAAGGWRVTSRR